MKTLTSRSDRHLNLFHSYRNGRDGDLDRIGQLEDNVTRAFILTLSGLEPQHQQLFHTELLGRSIPETDDLRFDLQSISDKRDLRTIQKARTKILLTLSRNGYDEDLRFDDRVARLVRKIKDLDDVSRKNYMHILRHEYVANLSDTSRHVADLNHLDTDLDIATAQGAYELLKGARPDAWIFSNHVAVMIEAKIGGNGLYKAQLYRHLTDLNQGFGIAAGDVLHPRGVRGVQLVHRTWSDVVNAFLKLQDSKDLDAKEEFLITEFKEYLNMSGEVLSFARAMDGSEWTENDQKNQMRLMVDRLDAARSVTQLGIASIKRPLRGAWQQFGENNLYHFTVYVGDKHIGIDLTLRHKLLSKIASDDALWTDFAELVWQCHLRDGWNNNSIPHRYGLDLMEYHRFDHYPGLQTGGENREEMNFSFNMEWVNRRFKKEGEDRVQSFLGTVIRPLFQRTLQAGIVYKIPYPNIAEKERRERHGKPYGRYEADHVTLSDSSQLVSEFETFIERMGPMYRYLESI